MRLISVEHVGGDPESLLLTWDTPYTFGGLADVTGVGSIAGGTSAWEISDTPTDTQWQITANTGNWDASGTLTIQLVTDFDWGGAVLTIPLTTPYPLP